MGVRKADELTGYKTKRTKMYMRFLKKNMPAGTKIWEDDENVIFFELPAVEQEMPQAAE